MKAEFFDLTFEDAEIAVTSGHGMLGISESPEDLGPHFDVKDIVKIIYARM